MKNIRKDKDESLKRGKGNKEAGRARTYRDPGDIGDPRASRGKNATPQKLKEKGDERRVTHDIRRKKSKR